MPRNGSGTYSRPPGIDAITDHTVDSGRYNANVADVEFDLNWPRPITSGGTGANNPVDARANIGAEAANIQITNYDSHIFQSGSLYSIPGALNAPDGSVSGDYFEGYCYGAAPGFADFFIEVRALSTNKKYFRRHTATGWSGVWTPSDGSDRVLRTGDTMTGSLVVPDIRTGNTIVDGNAAGIEIGMFRTGNGAAYLDLVAQQGVDFNARVIRDTGADGGLLIVNLGTGIFKLSNGSAPITFETLGGERLRLGQLSGNPGFTFASLNANMTNAGGAGLVGAPGTPELYYYAAGAGHRFRVGGIDKFHIDDVSAYSDVQILSAKGINAFGAYSYLGGFNTSGVRPVTTGGGGVAIGWNYSGGDAEMNFWNTYPDPTGMSFTFSQMLSASSHSDLLKIMGNGDLLATGSLYAASGGLTIGNGAPVGLYGDGGNVAVRTYGSGGIYFQTVGGANTYGDWNLTRLHIANSLQVDGTINASNDIIGNSGGVYVRAPGGTNGAFYVRDESNATRAYFGWIRSDDTVRIHNYATAVDFTIRPDGGIELAKGFKSKAGADGAFGGNVHNLEWRPGQGVQLWVDNSPQGTIAIVSDYRTKKNVTPLRSTWRKVKRLRPISYSQKEFDPPRPTGEGTFPSHGPLFTDNDEVRWGFVAHELQDTLVPSAANGVKDGREIQYPNLTTVVAALAKALQEAMERIEVLEVQAGLAATPKLEDEEP